MTNLEQRKAAALKWLKTQTASCAALYDIYKTLEENLQPSPTDKEVDDLGKNLIRALDYVDEDSLFDNGTVGAKHVENAYIAANTLIHAAKQLHQQWQTMDSAPRDGAEFIALKAKADGLVEALYSAKKALHDAHYNLIEHVPELSCTEYVEDAIKDINQALQQFNEDGQKVYIHEV